MTNKVKVTLSYRRDEGAETSSGIIVTDWVTWDDTFHFKANTFAQMISRLSQEIAGLDCEVFIQRTDREGLVPYKLDQTTVDLIRDEPGAAIVALTYTQVRPSTAIRKAKQRDVPIVVPPVKIGTDVLAEAFGDYVCFRVRKHELECPGCGFWGIYASPGLLASLEREGQVFKTVFACQKKCKGRFMVTCMERWGSVDVGYLLEKTPLSAFYLPRSWNSGRSWITREELQSKHDQFKKEKESCSTIQ